MLVTKDEESARRVAYGVCVMLKIYMHRSILMVGYVNN